MRFFVFVFLTCQINLRLFISFVISERTILFQMLTRKERTFFPKQALNIKIYLRLYDLVMFCELMEVFETTTSLRMSPLVFLVTSLDLGSRRKNKKVSSDLSVGYTQRQMTICLQFVYILSTICLQFVFNLSTICPNFVLVLSEFCHNKNKTKQRQMTNCMKFVDNLSFVFVLSCFCIQFVICLYFVLFLL